VGKQRQGRSLMISRLLVGPVQITKPEILQDMLLSSPSPWLLLLLLLLLLSLILLLFIVMNLAY
jgi:hypothetical protein